MNELILDFSVNHIIKYKNGECLYILKKLGQTPTTYTMFDPIVHFVHATKKIDYSNVFANGIVFSDKFSFVDWCDIPHVKKREIIKAYPELKKSLYDNFEYNQLYGNSRISIKVLDERIRDIAKLGGYKKADGIDLKKIEKEILGKKPKEEPHSFFGIGSNYSDIRPKGNIKPDPVYKGKEYYTSYANPKSDPIEDALKTWKDTGIITCSGSTGGGSSMIDDRLTPDRVSAICNSLIDGNGLTAGNGITINNPITSTNLYMNGNLVGDEVLMSDGSGEITWCNPMEGIVIRSNKKKQRIIKFKEQKAIILK